MNGTASIAAISPDEIAVTYSARPDVGREYLTFDITGWDDVRKICKKVLVYDGRKFTFGCWNSDRMVCIFSRPLNGNEPTGIAKIVRR